ncbi:hypothetical protein CASFOL_018552 [Castilleja foliolosa]|uniref:Uncharacterized protein n=1 Tax=Castilleja foliolosa TaxID=1961234 RepID=A0ABD3D7Y2_9LAMI
MWLASCNDVPKYRRTFITPGMFPSGNLYAETPKWRYCENGDINSENGLQSTDASVAPSNSFEVEVSELPLERCMRN